MELRPTDAGQVGLFPEQIALLPWLRTVAAGRDRARASSTCSPTPGHDPCAGPGGRPGDPRRRAPAVGRLGPPERRRCRVWPTGPVRWIVDDARAFARREARRGRRYDGFVLDPPRYGHGPEGTRWELADGCRTCSTLAAVAADERSCS